MTTSSTGALGGGHLGHMSNVPYYYLYSFHVNFKIVPCGMSNLKNSLCMSFLVILNYCWDILLIIKLSRSLVFVQNVYL